MWTETLQQQTRDHFENVMNGAFMKHFGDSRFGLCIFIDGKYVITDRGESEDIWEYNSMDDLIEAGWALD